MDVRVFREECLKLEQRSILAGSRENIHLALCSLQRENITVVSSEQREVSVEIPKRNMPGTECWGWFPNKVSVLTIYWDCFKKMCPMSQKVRWVLNPYKVIMKYNGYCSKLWEQIFSGLQLLTIKHNMTIIGNIYLLSQTEQNMAKM